MIHTIFRDDEIIVALDGYPYTVPVDDHRYEDVCNAIADNDEEGLADLLVLKKRFDQMYIDLEDDGLEYRNGDYFYYGNPVPMDLNDYLREALYAGSAKPVINFIKSLFENPNHDTRMRLFGFLDHNKMPIDEEGRFLAFKVVKSNYYDKHSGTVYNGVGTVVPRMSWSEVDTDNENTCSRGYHACSKEYISHFNGEGDRLVTVAVYPEDVGAIPSDYNQSKLRCRQYEVICDITDQYLREKENVSIRGGYINPKGCDYKEGMYDIY